MYIFKLSDVNVTGLRYPSSMSFNEYHRPLLENHNAAGCCWLPLTKAQWESLASIWASAYEYFVNFLGMTTRVERVRWSVEKDGCVEMVGLFNAEYDD